MTSEREFTVKGIVEDAIQGVKDYIEACEAYKKPNTVDEKEKLFQYLVESPADWTGYYEPETTLGGIDWEAIDNFTSEDIITAIRFAQRYGYYQEDEPWVREVGSALRLYVSYFRFDEIIDTAYSEMKDSIRQSRLIKLFELWKEEEEVMWKKRDSDSNHSKYLMLNDIINILEDPQYAEDRFEVYGV